MANNQNKKKIYVGCSLTHATAQFRKGVGELKDLLREKFDILDFFSHTKNSPDFFDAVGGTPKEIFEWDTKCVRDCDLFLAICTYPSIGLGYELGVALEMKKAVIIAAEENAVVARILFGIDRPNVSSFRYKKLSEIADYLDSVKF